MGVDGGAFAALAFGLTLGLQAWKPGFAAKKRSGIAGLPRCFQRVGDVMRYAGKALEIAIDHVLCRSEEHTSELQSLMRISYAVFCLKKKNNQHKTNAKTVRVKEQPPCDARRRTVSRSLPVHNLTTSLN